MNIAIFQKISNDGEISRFPTSRIFSKLDDQWGDGLLNKLKGNAIILINP